MSDDILRLKCDLSAALAGLEEAEASILRSIEKGMAVVVLDTLGESMRNAPILTGNLRGSGSARINGQQVGHTTNSDGSNSVETDAYSPKGTETIVRGEVGFDCEYALVQHEHIEFNHPRGGKAKFLEDTLKEKSGDYEAVIGECIRGEL